MCDPSSSKIEGAVDRLKRAVSRARTQHLPRWHILRKIPFSAKLPRSRYSYRSRRQSRCARYNYYCSTEHSLVSPRTWIAAWPLASFDRVKQIADDEPRRDADANLQGDGSDGLELRDRPQGQSRSGSSTRW